MIGFISSRIEQSTTHGWLKKTYSSFNFADIFLFIYLLHFSFFFPFSSLLPIYVSFFSFPLFLYWFYIYFITFYDFFHFLFYLLYFLLLPHFLPINSFVHFEFSLPFLPFFVWRFPSFFTINHNLSFIFFLISFLCFLFNFVCFLFIFLLVLSFILFFIFPISFFSFLPFSFYLFLFCFFCFLFFYLLKLIRNWFSSWFRFFFHF